MFKRGLVLGARLNVQNRPYGKITIQIILAISLKRGTPFLTRTNWLTKHPCFGPTVPNLPMKHSMTMYNYLSLSAIVCLIFVQESQQLHKQTNERLIMWYNTDGNMVSYGNLSYRYQHFRNNNARRPYYYTEWKMRFTRFWWWYCRPD